MFLDDRDCDIMSKTNSSEDLGSGLGLEQKAKIRYNYSYVCRMSFPFVQGDFNLCERLKSFLIPLVL